MTYVIGVLRANAELQLGALMADAGFPDEGPIGGTTAGGQPCIVSDGGAIRNATASWFPFLYWCEMGGRAAGMSAVTDRPRSFPCDACLISATTASCSTLSSGTAHCGNEACYPCGRGPSQMKWHLPLAGLCAILAKAMRARHLIHIFRRQLLARRNDGAAHKTLHGFRR